MPIARGPADQFIGGEASPPAPRETRLGDKPQSGFLFEAQLIGGEVSPPAPRQNRKAGLLFTLSRHSTVGDQCVLALDYAFGASRGPRCTAAPGAPARFCLIFQVVAPRSTERRPPLGLLVVRAFPLRSRSCEASPAPASLHVFVPARVSALLRSCAPAATSCFTLSRRSTISDQCVLASRLNCRPRGRALNAAPGAGARPT